MEQFRHIGEVLGSVKALMVLRDEIEVNQRQCSLILDIFSLAFETIAEEIRQNLKLEERNTKWKPLEFPLRELCRVFKEGELYIRQCLDSKVWWGKAISLSQNRDCIEFHIHNLLCYFPAVIEAIEDAGEVSGMDQEEKKKKKVMLSRKYDKEWNDPKLFQWRFGKQYLVPREICKQLENAWREDRWRLVEAIKEKRNSAVNPSKFSKNETRLADMMLNKLINECAIFPMTVLLGSKDYQMRRRLGRGREIKEIQWLGQSFAMRHFQGEKEEHECEVSALLSLSHPNILQYLCGFYDDNKKEFCLVMELMNKDLWTYMKENCGPRRQILFSISVVVDLMLQMARGMEYLHSKNIYHGDLNPYNILLKPRNSQEGYFQAKVAGFGLSSINEGVSPTSEDFNPSIWYAPEVLTEQERSANTSSKYSEKADAYSFGMICFQLLTGKVPFEDNHLQGERSNQNIKAGERPLFPYRSPKYLVNLIKKCWQPDPAQRPSFSSICRILRYTKKFLCMNTEHHPINLEFNSHELQSPLVDCYDIEATFLKRFPVERASNVSTVSQIPYEMFAYKVEEKGKISESNTRDKSREEAKDEPSRSKGENDDRNTVSGDDNVTTLEDSLPLDTQSVCSEAPSRKSVTLTKPTQVKPKKDQGPPKLRVTKSLPSSLFGRALRATKVNQPSLTSNRLSPTGRRPPQVPEWDRNSKGNQSQLVSTSSSLVRNKKDVGGVSDSKFSLKLKKRDQSPLTRYGNVADSNGSFKMKKSQLTWNPSLSRGRLRHASTENDFKKPKLFLPTHPLSTPRTCTGRTCGAHVSYLDGGSKVTRGRLSPLALSPLSPYGRSRKTCDQVYDSESSFMKRRGSLSPLALNPLTPFAETTSGNASD